MNYVTIYLTVSILLIIIVLSFNKIITMASPVINSNTDKKKLLNSKSVEGIYIENCLANSIGLLIYLYTYTLITNIEGKDLFNEQGLNRWNISNSATETLATIKLLESEETYNLGLLMLLSLLWSVLMIINPANLRESGVIMVLNALGIILMISSNALIGFYLGLELYSLSSYVLASGCEYIYQSNGPNENSLSGIKASSVSASLKYFILSAISSSLFLLGIILNKGALL